MADAVKILSHSPVRDLRDRQRRFFASGATRPLDFRAAQLAKLAVAIEKHEPQLLAAMSKDLGRHSTETWIYELAVISEEIHFAMRRLNRWARDRRVPTPLVLFPARSIIRPEPKGVVLIMGPWNYPLQLLLNPLVAAIAAGNCAICKPSELAPETSRALAALVAETFDPAYVSVVEGGVEAASALLDEPFDHIFFTGGTAIGRVIMEKAAKHLTPVTLELGGKSPAFVTRRANLAHAARRIAWGKFVNAGQTCVAPDYVLVDRALQAPLIDAIKKEVVQSYGADPRQSPDYPRIVNARHLRRLQGYLTQGEVVFGGESDEAARYMAPTVMINAALDAPIMQEEIFGPILPIVATDSIDEALAVTAERAAPLALYVFSEDKREVETILSRQTSGGAAVNDALLQLGNPSLPFGGVGGSGFGAYHGQSGFDNLSHLRSVLVRKYRFVNPLLRVPYKISLTFFKRLMRVLRWLP